jgi:hypothetical protein
MRLFEFEERARDGVITEELRMSSTSGQRGSTQLLITYPGNGDTAALWLLVHGYSNILPVGLYLIGVELRDQSF